MSKTPAQPPSRVADLARSVRARGAGLWRLRQAWVSLVDALASPSMGWGLLVAVAFVAASTALVLWSRAQPLVAVGRVMDETRLVRYEISTVDDALTQQRREAARQATPRVYVQDAGTVDAIIKSLENLPATLASAERLEAVDARIRDQFGLTPELLDALRAEAGQSGPGRAEAGGPWRSRVRALGSLLAARPLLDQQSWQRNALEGTSPTIKLVADGKALTPVMRGEAVNVEDSPSLLAAMQVVARDAGFAEPLRSLVVARLTINARPTYVFDPSLTAKDQNAAAEATPASVTVNPVGQVIVRRGEVLTEAPAALNRAEMVVAEHEMPRTLRLLRAAGVAGACASITLALAGYTVLFCPRVRRNAGRIAGVAGVLVVLLGVACVCTVVAPQWSALTTTSPTILVAILMAIAYDRRSALAYALLHGLLVCVALRQGVTTMAVMTTGTACVVASLKDIRDRNTLLRATVFTALGAGIACVLFGLFERPLSPHVLGEILTDAARGAGGAVALGASTLLLLPLIERAFNVTTGLTLIELRDPKQPLLRELQQRAPGTYNHSLNVATIAEAAADAIGADPLLAYVGALYHDIGKMNKPEYFVENQQGGPNKHDRLSPAMSLLIVVGHVKDGVELAREFRLPQPLVHFIEAHHGTTLVEFFFHRARKQAAEGEDDEAYIPDELEYRYPGPTPRTKEVAILMVADAVESACRAMPDPTPSRVDQLVRTIAHKRLIDGQFDACELTLRELTLITESISRTVASMNHSRVAYPEETAKAE